MMPSTMLRIDLGAPWQRGPSIPLIICRRRATTLAATPSRTSMLTTVFISWSMQVEYVNSVSVSKLVDILLA